MSQDNCVCCAGPQGPQGIPGVQGGVGPQGPAGAAGSNGINGKDGAAGAVGPVGPQGVQGDMGLPGADGAPGEPGAPGANGMSVRGPQGLQGIPGQNGTNGVDGKDGVDGVAGAQGIPGPMGPAGIQGPQGPKGDCVACPCDCAGNEPEFAEVYSSVGQTLAASTGVGNAGGVVLLEHTIFATANIDVSNAASLGVIKINKAGWYDVATGMCGSISPIPTPLPCFTLSLFQNGVVVPGSTFANVPLSPEQQSNEIVADVFVHCNVGDVLTLANTSSNQVILTAPTLGTFAQTNSAYLKIQLLKAD